MNQANQIEFTEFFTALRKYWVTFVLIISLVVGSVAVWVLSQPRQYTATSTVLLTSTKIPGDKGSVPARPGISPLTMAKLIQNRQIAEAAIRKFALDEAPLLVSPEEFWDKIVDVRVVGDTGFMDMVVTFHDPVKASELANFVAEASAKLNEAINKSDAVSSRNYLKEQMDEALKRLEKVNIELIEFQSTNNVRSLQNSLADLEEQRREVERRLFETNLFLMEVSSNPLISSIREVEDKIQKLRDSQQYIKLQSHMNLLLDKRKSLEKELLSAQLKAATPGDVESLESQKRFLDSKLRDIDDSLRKFREKVGNQDARASIPFQTEMMPLLNLKTHAESELLKVTADLERKRSESKNAEGGSSKSRVEYIQSLISENERRFETVSKEWSARVEELRELERLRSSLLTEKASQERYLQTVALRDRPGAPADSGGPKQDDLKSKDLSPLVLGKRKEALGKELRSIEERLRVTSTRYVELKRKETDLSRESSLAQNAHEHFANSYAQASTAVLAASGDLKVVGKAFPPKVPKPRYLREKLGAAAASGFVVAVILVFCLETWPGALRRKEAAA